MGNFLISSSIGKKLIMSLSGCFLILFLLFHLAMNVTVIFSQEAYNSVAAFLGANWYALIGTVVLALGVLVHVVYALVLTAQNLRARGAVRYAETRNAPGVAWSSKNMFVLGAIVFLGLIVHLYNFWYNMQLVEVMGEHVNKFGYGPTDGSALIRDLFASPVYVAIYIVWFAAIWMHLTHGMWSMMQTVGWANKTWYPRLKLVANVISTLMMLGYASIPVLFYLKSLGITVFGLPG